LRHTPTYISFYLQKGELSIFQEQMKGRKMRRNVWEGIM